MTGFLEESPGVHSMTRLAVAALIVGILAMIGAICIVAVHGGEHAAGIIGAIGGAMIPLAGGVWGALHERTGGADA